MKMRIEFRMLTYDRDQKGDPAGRPYNFSLSHYAPSILHFHDKAFKAVTKQPFYN